MATIDITKHTPARPKRLFQVSLLIFLASSVLLGVLLFCYRPLKPFFIKASLHHLEKDKTGYRGMLLPATNDPGLQSGDQSLRFTITGTDGSKRTLVVRPDGNTTPHVAGQSFPVTIEGLDENTLVAGKNIEGQLIIVKETKTSLLTNLLQ